MTHNDSQVRFSCKLSFYKNIPSDKSNTHTKLKCRGCYQMSIGSVQNVLTGLNKNIIFETHARIQ